MFILIRGVNLISEVKSDFYLGVSLLLSDVDYFLIFYLNMYIPHLVKYFQLLFK